MIKNVSLHFKMTVCSYARARVKESLSVARASRECHQRLTYDSLPKGRVPVLAVPTTNSHPANNDACEETAVSDYLGNSANFRRASRCSLARPGPALLRVL